MAFWAGMGTLGEQLGLGRQVNLENQRTQQALDIQKQQLGLEQARQQIANLQAQQAKAQWDQYQQIVADPKGYFAKFGVVPDQDLLAHFAAGLQGVNLPAQKDITASQLEADQITKLPEYKEWQADPGNSDKLAKLEAAEQKVRAAFNAPPKPTQVWQLNPDGKTETLMERNANGTYAPAPGPGDQPITRPAPLSFDQRMRLQTARMLAALDNAQKLATFRNSLPQTENERIDEAMKIDRGVQGGIEKARAAQGEIGKMQLYLAQGYVPLGTSLPGILSGQKLTDENRRDINQMIAQQQAVVTEGNNESQQGQARIIRARGYSLPDLTPFPSDSGEQTPAPDTGAAPQGAPAPAATPRSSATATPSASGSSRRGPVPAAPARKLKGAPFNNYTTVPPGHPAASVGVPLTPATSGSEQ